MRPLTAEDITILRRVASKPQLTGIAGRWHVADFSRREALRDIAAFTEIMRLDLVTLARIRQVVRCATGSISTYTFDWPALGAFYESVLGQVQSFFTYCAELQAYVDALPADDPGPEPFYEVDDSVLAYQAAHYNLHIHSTVWAGSQEARLSSVPS